MSGDRFPNIMGIMGLLDGLIGLALWLSKALMLIFLIIIVYAIIVG